VAQDGIPVVRRHAAMIVTVAIVLFVGLLVLRGLAGLLAERKRNQVHRAWAETLGSSEALFEQYPDRPANETALLVEELTAELGIDIAPERVERRARPTDETERDYRGARFAIGDLLQRRLQSPGPASDPAPPEVAVFLDAHDATLDRLRRLLATGDPPIWSRRLETPFAKPVPNLRGHVDLHRLLLLDALLRHDAGEMETALAGLEASWNLNAVLRDEPDLTAQGIALTVARLQFGALRRFGRLPSEWRSRVREHDHRESYLDALRYEGWVWSYIHDPATRDQLLDDPVSRIVRKITGPYVDYSAADVSDRWRLLLIRTVEADAICDAAPLEAGVIPTMQVPGWNLVGRLVMNDLSDTIRRLARYDLDLELTSKVLELRDASHERDARWPDSLPGGDASTACTGERWEYSVSPEGGVSLSLSREIDWGSLSGMSLPTRFAVPANVPSGSAGT
jgi:hypothetical protein